MAVCEGVGHGLGVEPGVDQRFRVTSEGRMSLGFMVVRGRFVVSLISRSCVLAANLPVLELGPEVEVGGTTSLLLFFLALITTPSSKVSSSSKLDSEPRAMPVTVARSSAAAGPARRSAVATASFSSSKVTLGFLGRPVRGGPTVLRWLRAGPGPPKRKVARGILVDDWVWLWSPAARGSRLSSRAQSSAPAAGTMELGGSGREGGQLREAGAPTFSPSLRLSANTPTRRGGVV